MANEEKQHTIERRGDYTRAIERVGGHTEAKKLLRRLAAVVDARTSQIAFTRDVMRESGLEDGVVDRYVEIAQEIRKGTYEGLPQETDSPQELEEKLEIVLDDIDCIDVLIEGLSITSWQTEELLSKQRLHVGKKAKAPEFLSQDAKTLRPSLEKIAQILDKQVNFNARRTKATNLLKLAGKLGDSLAAKTSSPRDIVTIIAEGGEKNGIHIPGLLESINTLLADIKSTVPSSGDIEPRIREESELDPDEMWLVENVTKIRDFTKDVYASSFQEQLKLSQEVKDAFSFYQQLKTLSSNFSGRFFEALSLQKTERLITFLVGGDGKVGSLPYLESLYAQIPLEFRDHSVVISLNTKLIQPLRELSQRLEATRDVKKSGADALPGHVSVKRDVLKVDEVRSLTFRQLYELIVYYSLDPYSADPNRDYAGDPLNAEIVLSFQKFDIKSRSVEEKREYQRLKLLLFYRRYRAKNSGDDNMPAARPEGLLELMQNKNWNLTRQDIISFTRDSRYGDNVREMFAFARRILTRRTFKGHAHGEEAEWRALFAPDPTKGEDPLFMYGPLANKVDGKNPEERLYDYLKLKFVDSGKMTQEVFETSYGLFYTFDLYGDALGIQQKFTQTRQHNTHQKEDPNDKSRPLHIWAHKIRYGLGGNPNGWLSVFTSKYPDFWANAHGTEEKHHIDGTQHRQEMGIAYMDGLFDLKGIRNSIYPDPHDPNQRSEFIRYWMPKETEAAYLSGGLNRFFKNKDTFIEAKRRFVRESVSGEVKIQIEQLERRGRTNKAIQLIDYQFINNFKELWANQWDLSIFPDQQDFVTEYLWNEGGTPIVQETGNYNTALTGWDNIRRLTKEKVNGGNRVKFEDLDRLWEEFVSKGIGLAKMVKWRHQSWFVPMLRFYIGRISRMYDWRSRVGNQREARIELANKLVELFDQSMNIDQGGLGGLPGFRELRDELDPKKNVVGEVVNQLNRTVNDEYAGVPELLRPAWPRRAAKLRHYIEMEYEHEAHAPLPRGISRVNPVGYGSLARRRIGRERYISPLSHMHPPFANSKTAGDLDTTASSASHK